MSYSTENLFESTRIFDVPKLFFNQLKTTTPNETRFRKLNSAEVSTDSSLSLQLSPENMRVYLRLRPRNPKSKLARKIQDAMYTVVNSRMLITKFSSSDGYNTGRGIKSSDATCKKFKFTKIFDAHAHQDEVFHDCTSDTIMDFLSGHSSTIMTYGTTNSGKTFTLHGTKDLPGIIPRSIQLIYSAITCTLSPWYKPINGHEIVPLSEKNSNFEGEMRRKFLSKTINSPEHTDAWRALEEASIENTDGVDGEALYSVWLSFAEIYNENIHDLLVDNEDNRQNQVKLVTDKQGRSFIHGLTLISATTGYDAYQIFLTGKSRLNISSQSETASSLSHSIFSITLLKYFKACNPDDVEMSTMTFCDLAGAGRSKANCTTTDDRKHERSIKTGLLALGKCIQSVYACQSGKVSTEIIGPFRESKLTRLFQRPLSGREPLTIIANINLSPEFYAENQRILQLCSVASKIHVTPSKELKKYFTSELTIPSPIIDSKIEGSISEFEVKDDGGCREFSEENLSNIREGMANFSTSIIRDMEVDWMLWSSEATGGYRENLSELSLMEVKYCDGLTSRKRRRVECGDHLDEHQSSLNSLEMENARIVSDCKFMKKRLENIKRECNALRGEKNYYSFELSLVNKELTEIRNFLVSESSISFKYEDLLEYLKAVVGEKNGRIKFLEESLNAVKEHEAIERIEAEESWRENSNDELNSIFIGETAESNLSESSSEETIRTEISATTIQTWRNSLEFGNIEKIFNPNIFETIDKTLDSVKIDEDSGIVIGSRTMSSTITRNIFIPETEEKGVQASDCERLQEQKRIMDERVEKLKYDYDKLQSEHLQGSIRINELSKELDHIRQVLNRLKEVMYQSDEKVIAYQLRLVSQDIDLENLKECNMELKNELSKAQLEREKLSLQCISDHLPKINKLEQELSEKAERISCLNSKILTIEHHLQLLNNLNERVIDFSDILEKCRQERVELKQELQERRLSQSSLECRLKLLSSRVQKRENEITSLRTDLAGIVKMNTVNGERANELSQDIANALTKLTTSKEEMRLLEIERIQLERASSHEISALAACFKTNTEMLSMIHEGDEDTKSELDRVKLLLLRKKREMSLFKKNRDSTIRRYESLVRKLQGDIERNNRELLRVRGHPRRTISKESLESLEEESSKQVHRGSVIKGRSSKRTFNMKNKRSRHHCRLTCSARRFNSQIVTSLTSLDVSKSNDREVFDVQEELPLQKVQTDHRHVMIPSDMTTPSITSSSDDSTTDYKEFSKWMKIKRTNGRTQFVIRQAEITLENAVRRSCSDDS